MLFLKILCASNFEVPYVRPASWPSKTHFKVSGFKVTAIPGGEGYPKAHTCFNEIELPLYETKEKMKEILDFVIKEGSEGYGFGWEVLYLCDIDWF